MSCCGEDSEFGYVAGTGSLPNANAFPELTDCGPCEPSDAYIVTPRDPLPQITSPLAINVTPTVFFTYVITASSNPTLFFSPSFPSWMTFDGIDTLSGTPPIDTSGNSFQFVVGANNRSGQVTASVNGGIAPYVTSGDNPPATSGELFSYKITASNIPISFNATSLPAWATFDNVDTVSGTPPTLCVDAEYIFSVTATNIYGTSVNHSVTVDVEKFPTPIITSTLSTSANEGVLFTYILTASNDPISFNVSGLPSWASFDGIDTVSGTPPFDCFLSTYPKDEAFTVYASNICGDGDSSNVVINENGFPSSLYNYSTIDVAAPVTSGLQTYFSSIPDATQGQVGPGTSFPLGFIQSEIEKIFNGSTSWTITSAVIFTPSVGGTPTSFNFTGSDVFPVAQQTCPPAPQSMAFNVEGGLSQVQFYLFQTDGFGNWMYRYGGLFYPHIECLITPDGTFEMFSVPPKTCFSSSAWNQKLWKGGGLTSSNSSNSGILTFDEIQTYDVSNIGCDILSPTATQIHAGGIDISFT